jgi:hypothetical protein
MGRNKIYTEEEMKIRNALKSMKWKLENQEKVKEINKRLNQDPKRKIKEKTRILKRYHFKKECQRLNHLGDLFL